MGMYKVFKQQQDLLELNEETQNANLLNCSQFKKKAHDIFAVSDEIDIYLRGSSRITIYTRQLELVYEFASFEFQLLLSVVLTFQITPLDSAVVSFQLRHLV